MPPMPLVIASQPPKPNGVGVGLPSIVTLRSLRGMLTFRTLSLKSPCLPRDLSTPSYSAGTVCPSASPETNSTERKRCVVFISTPRLVRQLGGRSRPGGLPGRLGRSYLFRVLLARV